MDIELAIQRKFEAWGFSVEKVSTSSDKRPDFLVRDGDSTYLVEVKSREDDADESVVRNEVLSRGDVYGEHKALVRKNTVAGIIRDAYDQLKNYGDSDWLRVIWLCATDRAQLAKFEQFKAALYGKTQIFDLDGDGHHRPCYFFTNSDFFRYRDVLDAAIVSTLYEATLCLNPHSIRFDDFRGSKLTEHFGSAICDPIAEEVAGDAYIVDSAIDRQDEERVMDYLRGKYHAPKLSKIDLGWHSGTVLEPDGA